MIPGLCSNETTYYQCAIQELVVSWRDAFGAPDAWFGSVQLAAYTQVSKAEA